MSHFLDRLTFFRHKHEPFANGHGVLTEEDRKWENAYRSRWSHDKIARSTHGVNCTGSCSWKIYVKNGIITWETQQTDYPRTRPDLPNHEPRGCPRGASYSWYVYSAQRIKYPMMRGALAELWREARKTKDPIEAWQWIVEDPERSKSYKSQRGLGGFVRSNWDEAYEMVAAANCYTIKKYGPDRVIGFSPIPAMSMVSYASGARYLGLIGGVPLSFYDWYCDLPPASPQTWGEQTDVAESADWYNSNYLLVWGSNIPMTRTPDAHFYTEVRYKGTKTVAVSSDFGEMAKFSDIWLSPRQGTDAALAMAMGHVILKEFHIDNPSDYFQDYCRRLTDMPVLVCLKEDGGSYRPEYTLRASQLSGNFGEEKNPDWKVLAWNEKTDSLMLPNGSIGFRWDGSGKWNLETKAQDDQDVQAALSLKTCADDVVRVGFDYFGGEFDEEKTFRKVPVKRITLADGSSQLVATVFDLLVAQYGVDNGLGDENVAKDYFDDKPYTPKWQEKHTGVAPERVIQVAREFAQNAHDTKGRSMIIVGAGLNHWYYLDMNYRGLINMLMMCGTIGKSGGGWCHYVGQEKLRPQSGWAPLTFALDWHRPARQMAGTSFFYNHTGQYRRRRRYAPPDHDRLQRQSRPHGLDAERAAVGNQSAGHNRCGRKSRHGAGGLCGERFEGRHAGDVLRRSGKPEKLAAQYVYLAFQHFGFFRQRPRIFPEIPARHAKRPDERRRRLPKTCRSEAAGRRGRQAGFVHAPGFPHEHHLPVRRRDFPDRHLVRKTRSEHVRHAPVHPSVYRSGAAFVAEQIRLGNL